MSDYGTLNTKLNSCTDNSQSSLSAVKNVSFDGVWSGAAYDALSGSLEDTVAKAEIEITNCTTFSSAMSELDTYKTKKERYNELSNLIANVSYPKKEKDPAGYAAACSKVAAYKSEQATLKGDMSTLKSSIESKLSSIEPNTADLSLVKFSFDGDFSLDFDVADLFTMYNNGSLKLMNSSKSLYEYYDVYDDNGNLVRSGKDYIEGIIVDIQNKYSGREAAVNCGLAMLQLASDVGLKINYEHAGTNCYKPYVPTSSIASGVDCNPFVSWCLDKGVDGGYQWRPVENFTSQGDKIEYTDWSNAQAGDVLANGGHVMMIVENNPENGTFTVMHASGTQVGITMSERSYAALRNDGYTVRDMTNVYNGTYDTDRWGAFGQYVNPETWERDYV